MKQDDKEKFKKEFIRQVEAEFGEFCKECNVPDEDTGVIRGVFYSGVHGALEIIMTLCKLSPKNGINNHTLFKWADLADIALADVAKQNTPEDTEEVK